jgi:putative hydrolase of the HAD superfamily
MRALICDLGNVVALFDHRQAADQLAALTGGRVTSEAVFQHVFGTSLEEDFDCGRLSSRDFVGRVKQLIGEAVSDEAVVEAWCDIFRPNEELIELLGHLKEDGSRLVLASNTNALHFEWIAGRFGARLDCFDATVLSYRIGCRKPDAVFFGRCLERAGTAPGSCVYLDDRRDFADAAAALGMAAVVYQPGMDLTRLIRPRPPR